MQHITLEYIWTTSDNNIKSLLHEEHHRFSSVMRYLPNMRHLPGLIRGRVLLSELYRKSLSKEEQQAVEHPDFFTIITSNPYPEALYKLNYTSLQDIWNLDGFGLRTLLNLIEVVVEQPETPQSLDHYRLLLAMEYKKQGRLIDSNLLTIPNSSETLMRYGVKALKDRLLVRDFVSPHFDELGLANMISEYTVESSQIYFTDVHSVVVVDPIIGKALRHIPIMGSYHEFVGAHKDLLYITMKVDRHFNLYSVSLFSPTVIELITMDVLDAYVYKNLLCKRTVKENHKWTMTNLDTGKVERTIAVSTGPYQCRDKYCYDTSSNIWHDLTTDDKYTLDNIIGRITYKGVIDEDTLLITANNRLISANLKTNEIVNRNIEDIKEYEGSVIYDGKIFLICDECVNEVRMYDSKTLELQGVIFSSTFELSNLHIDEASKQLIFLEAIVYASQRRIIFLNVKDGSVIKEELLYPRQYLFLI
jgi:hypothetical protein